MLAPTLYDKYRKSYELTRALRDLWARVMFGKSSKVDNLVPRASPLCLPCRRGKNPGSGWSRASQNLGGEPNMC